MTADSLSGDDSKRSKKAVASAKTSESHHSFALQEYGNALKLMRRSGSDQSIRTRLLCIMLTVCFETYHGNHNHVKNTSPAQLQMVLESFARATQQSQIGIHMVLQVMIERYIVKWSSGRPGVSKWMAKQEAIDDELIQAFERLEVNIGPGPTNPAYSLSRELLRKWQLPLLNEMPPLFVSIREARYWLEKLTFGLFKRDFSVRPITAEVHRLKTTITCRRGGKPDAVIPEDLFPFSISKEDAARAEPWLNRWKIAFENSKLFDRTDTLKSSTDHLAAAALKLQYMTTSIRVKDVLLRSQIQIDEFLPHFEEMVSLGKTLISNSKHNRFSFDMVYVIPLYIVARCCRDPSVRRKAISLLKEAKIAEWGQDSSMCAGLAEMVMHFEEEFMIDGFVPEYARAYGLDVCFDMQSGRATASCLQRSPDMAQEIVRLLDISSWMTIAPISA